MNCRSAVAFFFLAVLTAVAQTNPPDLAPTNFAASASRDMSLQDCLREALAHNFDVQIEQTKPEISLYDLRSAYAGYYEPSLTISAEHDYDKTGDEGVPPDVSRENKINSSISGSLPWGTSYTLSANAHESYGANALTNFFDGSSGTVSLGVTQPLLRDFWIDSGRLSIRLAKNSLKSSEQDVRDQMIKRLTDVIDAYYELIFARENLKVQREALKLAETQLDQDRQRSQIGTIAELDVQQDEAQAAQSRAGLIDAENTLAVAENTLKNLITDDYRRWHEIDIQPSETLTATMEAFDLQDSWNKGLSLRPDVLQGRLDAERQGIQLRFDRNQLFPQLDLTGSYGYNGQGVEFSDTTSQWRRRDRPSYSYGLVFSIPLGEFGNRNQYKSSKVSLKQVLLQLKQTEQNALVDIDNAIKKAQSKFQSVEATRQARIYAEAALSAEQKKYDVGKSTTFTVLQLQNKLTTARSQEIRALADYKQALADLAEAEGTTLEQNRIDVAVK